MENNSRNKRKIAVTGMSGMLGRYLETELRKDRDVEIIPLLRDDYTLPSGVETLYHLAGTEEEADAEEINLGLTKRLLRAAEQNLPRNLVIVSSWRVYPTDAGENVDERHNTWTPLEAGRTKAVAEMEAEKWAARTGVCLTIARPARMFGNGVHGDTQRLFDRVVRGHYVHIRDNKAMTSAVTALDCARALVRLAGQPGIFNISDGRPATWEALVEAMGANTGVRKRLIHLPVKWAKTIHALFSFLPIVKETVSPEALEPFSRTLTLDNSKVLQATGIEFHDTLAVIAREDKTYPYDIE